MTRYCLSNVAHTYVYRRWMNLNAGVQYIWETRDLQGAHPDTYMYVVRTSDNHIVAKNDDYNGLASLIAHVPATSGSHLLLIRAYSKYSAGTCDLYESIEGGSPQRIENNVKFGGTPVSAHWKSDERIETTGATGDTYLYLIHGNTVLRNDDGGAGLHSKIQPGYSGYGTVVVGSYSRYSEGTTRLCNYYQSYLDNPGEEDEDQPVSISKAMGQFQKELARNKDAWEELAPDEREENIKRLRDKILGPDDIEQMQAPTIRPPKDFASAQERYERVLKENEKRLSDLPPGRRMAEMEKLAREKSEIFKGLVPLHEDWSAPR